MTVWYKRTATSNVQDYYTWKVATRPTGVAAGYSGYNSDFDGFEYWDGSKWKIESGTWTTATRPVTTNIAVGSTGYNEDTGMGTEVWNGDTWQTI